MNGQKRKEENDALFFLKEVISQEKYKDCIICDRPDIQDANKSIGVEVVTACFRNEKEFEVALHSNTMAELQGKNPRYSAEKLQRLSIKTGINDYSPLGFRSEVQLEGSIEELHSSIMHKHHLISKYLLFTHYELFILNKLDYLGEDDFFQKMESICSWYSEHNTGARSFETIYVCHYGYNSIAQLNIGDYKLVKHNNVRNNMP